MGTEAEGRGNPGSSWVSLELHSFGKQPDAGGKSVDIGFTVLDEPYPHGGLRPRLALAQQSWNSVTAWPLLAVCSSASCLVL